MTNEQKPNRVVFQPSAEFWDRIEQIKSKRLLLNNSEVIRFCIAETYKREFPDYIVSRPKRLSPQEKAESQMLIEKTKIKIKEETAYVKQKDICDRLGGIEGDGYCFYKTYSIIPGNTVEEYKVSEPFEVLTENHLDFQYRDLYNQPGLEAKKQIEKLIANQNSKNETIQN